MCRLNVVRVIVSPAASHAFGISVIGYHIAVIREGLMTDGAHSILFYDLPLQQLPHLGGRP